MAGRRLSALIGSAVVATALVGLVWAERRRPLRPSVEPRWRHELRNLAIAVGSAAAVRLVETPLVMPAARLVERRRLGLVAALGLPPPLAAAATLVLLDYTLYLWHVLTHRVPWLWRLHVVHHVDLDLTATTALRFHFAEMAASAPWRAAQVLLIGVPPATLALWQKLLLVSVLFHHSNLRLPPAFERQLMRLVVTPRMHGIHHSVAAAQTHANWSSGLTVWDVLHGTQRRDPDQPVIGVPAYRAAAQVGLGAMLALPFRRWPPTGDPPAGQADGPAATAAITVSKEALPIP